MAGFENDVMVAKNINFFGGGTKPHNGIINAAGKLPIGTGNSSPAAEILGGTITSPNGSLIIGYSSPNITIVASGSVVGQTITGNTGGALSPTGGNWNIVTANSTPVFAGAGSTLTLDFGLSNLLIGEAGASITTATNNVGLGNDALAVLAGGGSNTCIGTQAGSLITSGNDNTLIGRQAGFRVNTGGQNILIGMQCATNMTGSSSNIIIGRAAGSAYVSGANNNIVIGDSLAGTAGEDNVIRIGSTATTCFIDGIDGVNVGSVAKVVTMGTSDQLGTATITAGTGITVTPGANTITIATTVGGFPWTDISGGVKIVTT